MVVNKIKLAKSKFEVHLANKIKEDSKTFYAYVKSKSRGKGNIGPLRDSGGKLVSDDRGMGNILNDYFGSVFTRKNLATVPGVERGGIGIAGGTYEKTDVNFTSEKVAKEIQLLKKNKSAGEDGLGSSFIKE